MSAQLESLTGCRIDVPVRYLKYCDLYELQLFRPQQIDLTCKEGSSGESGDEHVIIIPFKLTESDLTNFCDLLAVVHLYDRRPDARMQYLCSMFRDDRKLDTTYLMATYLLCQPIVEALLDRALHGRSRFVKNLFSKKTFNMIASRPDYADMEFKHFSGMMWDDMRAYLETPECRVQHHPGYVDLMQYKLLKNLRATAGKGDTVDKIVTDAIRHLPMRRRLWPKKLDTKFFVKIYCRCLIRWFLKRDVSFNAVLSDGDTALSFTARDIGRYDYSKFYDPKYYIKSLKIQVEGFCYDVPVNDLDPEKLRHCDIDDASLFFVRE